MPPNIKVCDAICGSGKTQSAIWLMNHDLDHRFIFVTQFLSEVERIKNGCPDRHFVSPETSDSAKTKLSSLRDLVAARENIATTHALFLSTTDEIKALLRAGKYVLILDEVVDVLCETSISNLDVSMMVDYGYASEENGVVSFPDEVTNDKQRGMISSILKKSQSCTLMRVGGNFFYWSLVPEIFTSFDSVIVLTYLFQYQELRYFFDVYGLKYQMIGTKKCDDHYEFCDIREMSRVSEIGKKIHIVGSDKLNSVGDSRCALSYSWYQRAKEDDFERLRKNLYNIFRRIMDSSAKDFMWTTFTSARDRVCGVLNKSFIVYNKRASNECANRHYLAYLVNNFPRTMTMRYFAERGCRLDYDGYAVSILVQWLFRSAIRRGEEVWIYVPSSRMRGLLEAWIEALSQGRDLEPLEVKKPAIPKKGKTKNGTGKTV